MHHPHRQIVWTKFLVDYRYKYVIPVLTQTVPFASICVMLCNINSFRMQFMLSYVSGGCGLLFIKIFYALASNAKFTLRSPFAKQLTLLFILTFAVGRSPLLYIKKMDTIIVSLYLAHQHIMVAWHKMCTIHHRNYVLGTSTRHLVHHLDHMIR